MTKSTSYSNYGLITLLYTASNTLNCLLAAVEIYRNIFDGQMRAQWFWQRFLGNLDFVVI